MVEGLLHRELALPDGTELQIQRAHRSLGKKPPPGANPRSIVRGGGCKRHEGMRTEDSGQKRHRTSTGGENPEGATMGTCWEGTENELQDHHYRGHGPECREPSEGKAAGI
ncbi:hypothetical protein CRENBAI_022516 [Crenichthys baileyi]|uniref:Uncharacterized protein n=1 Tax=Crenichthys baileyi TaxID=28760 RepID=A0AAV9SNN2_9TELE